MRIRRTLSCRARERRGAVVVMVAVAGTVIVGMAALTIDLGSMYIVRGELQRTADAAALAAAGRLAKYQPGISEANAIEEAQRIVRANSVHGEQMVIESGKDVTFGKAVWDATTSRYTFQTVTGVPTAVRVQVRMTKDSVNGPLNLLFARIFGIAEKDMWAKAAAMLVPRDISVVADLSGSMNDDSELQHYKETLININAIWRAIPIEYGNNGVGNGIDPQPKGNPPINDGPGTGPGDPGNQGGDHTRELPPAGPTWGRMNDWGTTEITDTYEPTGDAGLKYLPYGESWASDADVVGWLASVGYTPAEIDCLTSGTFDAAGSWKYRVGVALGLARWDSGLANGLWSKLPPARTKATRGNGDAAITGNEVAWLVPYPFQEGSWVEYIDNYMRSTATAMYRANPNFRYRFGLKTFINYHLEVRKSFYETETLWRTPEQPLEAVKQAVAFCMDLLTDMQVEDQVSLEIYAETAVHEVDLTKEYYRITNRIYSLQAGHYDGWTNMGGGIGEAIAELTGSRARKGAAKVIFLLTDGQPNVNEAGQAPDTIGGRAWALKKAAEAAGLPAQIYCISVGTDADRQLMQQIAQMGHGEEFYAAGSIEEYSSQLRRIFLELGSKRPVRLIE